MKKAKSPFYRVICLLTAAVFLSTSIMPVPYARAQSLAGVVPVLNLPLPGMMVKASPGYTPTLIKGITINPLNALQFDFIVHTGDSRVRGEELNLESNKLIKYFLAALTVPEQEMWVNLSPYEKDRIIATGFGQTEMGRDLLAQDYMLKQVTASLMYPEEGLGQEFWDRVHNKAYERFGITDVPVDTFNKVWIVPDKALVYEHDNSVFVVESHMKVMLEEDYLAISHQPSAVSQEKGEMNADSRTLTATLIKEILIPEIEKEVNEGKTFASLRQIYNSMILATWYKKSLRESLLGQVYVDQNKTKGVDTTDPQIKQKIYDQYLMAFKTGVYNYIKEDYDPLTQQIIPRKYFSGGFDPVGLSDVVEGVDDAMVAADSQLAQKIAKAAALEGDVFNVKARFDDMGPGADNAILTELKTRYAKDNAMQSQEQEAEAVDPELRDMVNRIMRLAGNGQGLNELLSFVLPDLDVDGLNYLLRGLSIGEEDQPAYAYMLGLSVISFYIGSERSAGFIQQLVDYWEFNQAKEFYQAVEPYVRKVGSETLLAQWERLGRQIQGAEQDVKSFKHNFGEWVKLSSQLPSVTGSTSALASTEARLISALERAVRLIEGAVDRYNAQKYIMLLSLFRRQSVEIPQLLEQVLIELKGRRQLRGIDELSEEKARTLSTQIKDGFESLKREAINRVQESEKVRVEQLITLAESAQAQEQLIGAIKGLRVLFFDQYFESVPAQRADAAMTVEPKLVDRLVLSPALFREVEDRVNTASADQLSAIKKALLHILKNMAVLERVSQGVDGISISQFSGQDDLITQIIQVIDGKLDAETQDDKIEEETGSIYAIGGITGLIAALWGVEDQADSYDGPDFTDGQYTAETIRESILLSDEQIIDIANQVNEIMYLKQLDGVERALEHFRERVQIFIEAVSKISEKSVQAQQLQRMLVSRQLEVARVLGIIHARHNELDDIKKAVWAEYEREVLAKGVEKKGLQEPKEELEAEKMPAMPAQNFLLNDKELNDLGDRIVAAESVEDLDLVKDKLLAYKRRTALALQLISDVLTDQAKASRIFLQDQIESINKKLEALEVKRVEIQGRDFTATDAFQDHGYRDEKAKNLEDHITRVESVEDVLKAAENPQVALEKILEANIDENLLNSIEEQVQYATTDQVKRIKEVIQSVRALAEQKIRQYRDGLEPDSRGNKTDDLSDQASTRFNAWKLKFLSIELAVEAREEAIAVEEQMREAFADTAEVGLISSEELERLAQLPQLSASDMLSRLVELGVDIKDEAGFTDRLREFEDKTGIRTPLAFRVLERFTQVGLVEDADIKNLMRLIEAIAQYRQGAANFALDQYDQLEITAQNIQKGVADLQRFMVFLSGVNDMDVGGEWFTPLLMEELPAVKPASVDQAMAADDQIELDIDVPTVVPIVGLQRYEGEPAVLGGENYKSALSALVRAQMSSVNADDLLRTVWSKVFGVNSGAIYHELELLAQAASEAEIAEEIITKGFLSSIVAVSRTYAWSVFQELRLLIESGVIDKENANEGIEIALIFSRIDRQYKNVPGEILAMLIQNGQVRKDNMRETIRLFSAIERAFADPVSQMRYSLDTETVFAELLLLARIAATDSQLKNSFLTVEFLTNLVENNEGVLIEAIQELKILSALIRNNDTVKAETLAEIEKWRFKKGEHLKRWRWTVQSLTSEVLGLRMRADGLVQISNKFLPTVQIGLDTVDIDALNGLEADERKFYAGVLIGRLDALNGTPLMPLKGDIEQIIQEMGRAEFYRLAQQGRDATLTEQERVVASTFEQLKSHYDQIRVLQSRIEDMKRQIFEIVPDALETAADSAMFTEAAMVFLVERGLVLANDEEQTRRIARQLEKLFLTTEAEGHADEADQTLRLFVEEGVIQEETHLVFAIQFLTAISYAGTSPYMDKARAYQQLREKIQQAKKQGLDIDTIRSLLIPSGPEEIYQMFRDTARIVSFVYGGAQASSDRDMVSYRERYDLTPEEVLEILLNKETVIDDQSAVKAEAQAILQREALADFTSSDVVIEDMPQSKFLKIGRRLQKVSQLTLAHHTRANQQRVFRMIVQFANMEISNPGYMYRLVGFLSKLIGVGIGFDGLEEALNNLDAILNDVEEGKLTADQFERLFPSVAEIEKGGIIVASFRIRDYGHESRIARGEKFEDSAMAAEQQPVGGIDLDSSLLDLQIKRDGMGVPLPLNLQPLDQINIQGFLPVIINVTPIENFSNLFGIS